MDTWIGNMLCFVFVITLVLPSFALNTGKQEIDINCTASDARKAGDVFFKNFDDIVKYSITDEKNQNKNFSIIKAFVGPIFEYVRVANKSCYHDTLSPERDSLEFYKFLRFSLKNGGFKEFLDTGGAECINAVKHKIAKCVTGTVGHINAANNKYFTLWGKTALMIQNKTCRDTNAIKLCTQNAMRTEGWYKCQYGNDNILYVGTLFDYMLERCNRILPNWAKSGNNLAKMTLSVKNVVISCLTIVLLVHHMT